MPASSTGGGRRREKERERPRLELALQLLDIRVETSRLLADAQGVPMDRSSECRRADRVDVMSGQKAAGVLERLSTMRVVVKRLRRKGAVRVVEVSEAMAAAKQPLSVRSIYRRLDYMAIIHDANGTDFVTPPDDPQWAAISRWGPDKLEKALRAARRERSKARAGLIKAKAGFKRPDLDRLRREMSVARRDPKAATSCRRSGRAPTGAPRKRGRSSQGAAQAGDG